MMSSETSLQTSFINMVQSNTIIPSLLNPPSLPPSLVSGVDVSAVKMEEERLMLADANRLKNDPSLSSVLSPGGATILHVAAAKDYLEVLE